MKAGYSAIGSQFMAVGADAMDLTDIIPTGYDKDTYVGGSISVQTLDAEGVMVPGSQYYWYDDADGTGWFDAWDEEVEPGQVKLNPGEGYWCTGNATTEKLQTSGEVLAVSYGVTLRAGYKMLCNPTPVAVNWNDDDKDGRFIVASGYNYDTYVGGSISAQMLDTEGVMSEQFYWYDDADGTGWFDAWDELVEGRELPAGVGIWVTGNSTSEMITFPGVALK